MADERLEKRVAKLEKSLSRLNTVSLFQSHALGVLLALIEYHAEKVNPLEKVKRGEIRRQYLKLLKSETEKTLARISDDNPALATQLRAILKHHLEEPD